ncbi:MAG: tetratricopeptide repeat protein [Cyanobacteriota bacterium]|nr:tetratricopeptide repeat protein [Cyanobacteriota bacterium]
MAASNSSQPFMQRFAKLSLAIVAPLILISFSLLPILQIFNPPQVNPSQLPTEQLQAEVEGYQEVLQREPENLTALRGLVELQLRLGQQQEAIAPLTQLTKLQPEDPSYGMLLGSLLLQTGERDKGLSQLRQLHERFPDDSGVLRELVRAEVETGNAQQAIALLEKQLEVIPGDPSLQMQLAEVYARSGNTTQAIVLYDQLIERDPSDFSPLLGKAMTLLSTASEEATRQEAKALFDRAVRLAPPQQRPDVERLATFYSQGNIRIANPNASPTASPAPSSSPQ